MQKASGFIHGTKHSRGNTLQSERPLYIIIGWELKSDIKEIWDDQSLFEKKVWGLKHPWDMSKCISYSVDFFLVLVHGCDIVTGEKLKFWNSQSNESVHLNTCLYVKISTHPQPFSFTLVNGWALLFSLVKNEESNKTFSKWAHGTHEKNNFEVGSWDASEKKC